MTIFFVIIAIIGTIFFVLICSKLIIDIKELEVINTKIKKLKVVISLVLFGKIKWLKLTIDNKKMVKLKNKTKVWNNFKNVFRQYNQLRKNNTFKSLLNQIKNIRVENTKIEAIVGTKNCAITALTVGVISTILGIILARITTNSQYKISPIYINKNYIDVSINSIISIKVVHIINIQKLGKEVYQKYGRTSNRRSYDNCNG